jgi:hypothetical protein
MFSTLESLQAGIITVDWQKMMKIQIDPRDTRSYTVQANETSCATGATVFRILHDTPSS